MNGQGIIFNQYDAPKYKPKMCSKCKGCSNNSSGWCNKYKAWLRNCWYKCERYKI